MPQTTASMVRCFDDVRCGRRGIKTPHTLELLRRAEEHLPLNRRPGKKTQRLGLDDASTRADRARRTAAVGAFRKATTRLVSSMLSFEESEDLLRAKELLPASSLCAQVHCDPWLEPG